ncbi:TonB-dependent receptor [Cytophagales bacterium LB-30]|uniref:TonB-dependent receptor n=1 Tax=Shiella aurantiaca TaxID=3058365 RepID=A0ABT8F5P6_9BACT|nr:TonB-dependent receptor [Shiella aurantiaca]MDN4165551.1 TonB-dependent receptor [Shiella aurantiaca]
MSTIILLGILAQSSFAQSEQSADFMEMSLEELMNIDVTTATKTSGKIDQVPAIIEVITYEQILSRGYLTLSQVLNDISDNHQDRANWGIGEPVSQNVGFGFRFDTGQNMLYLFNGQRINAFLPGNRFGGEEYLLENIDRIEIIRGPGSSLYGTGAFTAVVNIITKKVANSNEERFQIGTEYTPTAKGFRNTASVLTQVGNKGSLSGAFQQLTQEGQTLNVKNSLFGNAELMDGINQASSGQIMYSTKSFNLHSSFTNQSRNAFTGFNAINPTSMEELELFTYAYSVGSDYTSAIGNKSSIKVSAGWHQDNWTEVPLIPLFKLNDNGTALLQDEFGNSVLDTVTLYRGGEYIETSFFIDGQSADTRSLDAEIQYTLNYTGQNNIVIGGYIGDDRILKASRPSELNLSPLEFVPFRNINDQANNWISDINSSRQTIALFGQADYSIFENLNVSVGARWDNYSGKGALSNQEYSEFNPRTSVVYSSGLLGVFKALYGQATRIPNGFETLSSVGILGNPTNKPERISTFQFQWIKNVSNDLRFEIGAFRSEISNRLETNAEISDELKAQGFIGQFVNVGEGLVQSNNGIDGKVVARLNKSTAMINFTQYFGSNDGFGNKIAYIPNTMINGDINVPLGLVNINFGFNYRGEFTKSSQDNRPPVSSYLIGRLNVVYKPKSVPLQINLGAQNLFNTDYRYPASSIDFIDHFPARGIDFLIGLKYKIG